MTEPTVWKELAQGVLMLTCDPCRLNVGLVVGQERALLIDTGASAEVGCEIVKQARSVTDLPLGAVNSHDHFDHCFGNSALDGEWIWSHRRCAEHLRRDGHEQQRSVATRLRSSDPKLAQQIAASAIVTPSCVFEERLELDLGERPIVLVHPGRGHTDNDVVVWIEDARVLFTGDLVEEGSAPSFEDSFPLEWPDSLAALLDLEPEQVVPGHGAVVDAGFLRRQYADLQQLAELCRDGFLKGRRPWEFDVETAYPGQPALVAIRRAYDQLASERSGAWVERQPG
jgi:glyoxylase-like metal-dependent hydrolase (beta-lactamase superfamily II)